MHGSFSARSATHPDAAHEPQGRDSGLMCLLMLAQFHGIAADPAKLKHEYGQDPFDDTRLLLAARGLGFSAKLVSQPHERLHRVPTPCIGIDTEGRYFVLARVDAGGPEVDDKHEIDPGKARILIQRPGEPPQTLSLETFLGSWSSQCIFLTSKANFAGELSRFDFTWFIPAIHRARQMAASQHVQLQYQDFQARQRKLADEVAHFSQALPLAEQQAASYQQLAATKDVSVVAWQDKEQARLQILAQLTDARNQLATLTAEARKTAADQLAEARRVAAASTQDARRAASSGQLFTLKSPVDGTVQQLAVHTLGSAVQATAPLMQIVPSGGPIEVEAFIENKDKGFVHVGHDVAVKVETFEYTKYGTLKGRVSHVSQDAIQDEKRGLIYAVKVALDVARLDVDGKLTDITPGMAVSVEIKTGDRRIIDYVLSPLKRHAHEAANER